jgi:hypothetical protein
MLARDMRQLTRDRRHVDVILSDAHCLFDHASEIVCEQVRDRFDSTYDKRDLPLERADAPYGASIVSANTAEIGPVRRLKM